GKVHSHRFPGANTALPFANQDPVQFDIVKKFLQDGILTVDVFAVSEEPTGAIAAAGAAPAGGKGGGPAGAAPGALATLPEEGGFGGGYGEAAAGPPRTILAPIERASVRPGSMVRVDVVARTRKIGHFFPGGTVDSFDVWLELKAEDAAGKVLFWNGWVADE